MCATACDVDTECQSGCCATELQVSVCVRESKAKTLKQLELHVEWILVPLAVFTMPDISMVLWHSVPLFAGGTYLAVFCHEMLHFGHVIIN